MQHVPLLIQAALKHAATLGAVAILLSTCPSSRAADSSVETPVTIQAGTVFNLAPVFDTNGVPVFPWQHEVRGIVQVSTLGNCVVGFNVSINGGNACAGNHAFCLSGTMTITTLGGDRLKADVVGWADPDPTDSKANPSMYLLHYDTTITGGAGKLAGAGGQGVVTGAFMFSDTDAADDPDHSDNVFCNAYAGVATWRFDGVLRTLAGPGLSATSSAGKGIVVSWPASSGDWQLQHNARLGTSAWSDVSLVPEVADGRKQVAVPASEINQFYRLRKQ